VGITGKKSKIFNKKLMKICQFLCHAMPSGWGIPKITQPWPQGPIVSRILSRYPTQNSYVVDT